MISVIIPCYNSADTIGLALDSLVAQNFPDMEVIIINDGSEDNLEEIVLDYKWKLNIVLITQNNLGVSAARNKGLKNAKGEYIMFLDSDDFYGPKMIRNLFNAITTQKTDVVFCHCRYDNSIEEGEDLLELLSFEQFSNRLLRKNRDYQFCTAIYKNDIIKRNNICFSTRYANREDELFMWSYLVYCNTIIDMPKTFYHYIRRPTSASFRVDNRRFSSIDAAIEISSLLKDKDLTISQKYKRYEIPKGIVSLLRFFAKNERRDLFDDFYNKYFNKYFSIWLLTYPSFKVIICAIFVMISPSLFYIIEEKLKI